MNLLEQMREYGHERVAFHQDSETGLRAVIALHSTALGNALGGTRRWCYASEADAVHDVLRLSQGMTYKSACAGLPMGGGKSVVMLPNRATPMTEPEARAMGRFVDTFAGAYIAAEDVGTSIEYIDWMALETRHVMGGEKVSKGGDPSPFTAVGVSKGMRACLEFAFGSSAVDGRTIAIQGLGNVGSHLARILTEQGARVIGADLNKANVERCVDEYGITAASPDEILLTKCDVLAPCALGGVIDANLARKINCRIVCGGANNILDCPEEDAVVLKNRGVVYGVDFVVNAGGVISLSGQYLGFSRQQLNRMNDEIEETTVQVLREGEAMSSTYAAAIALGDRRIAAGARSKREKVHAD